MLNPESNPEIPVYRLAISDNPETGVSFVALVDEPAIQKNFIAFRNQTAKNLCFKATNPEQRIISGPLMIPDMHILREDPWHGEHFVFFDVETIKQVVLRFFSLGLSANVNLMHEPETGPDGVFMFESFLIDPDRGLSTPNGFDALPAGTWFGSYKIDNDTIWEHFIKTGEFKGFSVEGFFLYEQEPDPEEKQLQTIIDLIESVHNDQ